MNSNCSYRNESKLFTRIILIGICIISFYACNISDSKTIDFQTIPNCEWSSNEPIHFYDLIPDSVITESRTLSLNLRHSNYYPYRNLWLFIDYVDRENVIHTDTVEFTLADIYGNWYSSGFGALYEFSSPLKPSKINIRDIKSISVWHAMRCDTLIGISEIGITVKN
ncbi:MAG: gliding motility lipoprotein GldH [Muribaculaceae bacterium]|nr:gliding motility lipoprotein GldH [Muribaculaceae bacterium]